MNRVAAVRSALLNKKFPRAHFEATTLGGVVTEKIHVEGEQQAGCLLYFHGGGYFMGSIATHRGFGLRLSFRSKRPVYLIEYRLAPENPYPAALEDALASYRALTEIHPPKSIVIGGDSAGGGLALALLLKLKEMGGPFPSGVFCLSPWTDLSCSEESHRFNSKNDYMFQPEHFEQWAPLYLGKESPTHPLISPLYGDPSGLPPLFIQVGASEMLLDDSRSFARKAREAGVEVELEVWDGMQHVWQIALPHLPESKQAVQKMLAFINKRLPENGPTPR
ncbi:MAG: alpha/beta hydrolase [Bdellovibrionaceae bacterium]|nr:alpha/beta hydrolase [Bdellovibrionales bacterium]MCB9254084.1 alpha/beta hydrolase [Pseudobdellovibrionaceae bacterium]